MWKEKEKKKKKKKKILGNYIDFPMKSHLEKVITPLRKLCSY